MILTVTNVCNRRCSYCFEGPFLGQPAKHMTPDDIHKLMEFGGKNEQRHTIIGGEPTCHPHIIQLVDVIRRYSPIPPLFLSNGLGRKDIMEQLLRRGLRFLININHIDKYTDAQWATLQQNLNLLTDCGEFGISTTITKPEDDFSIVYDMLRTRIGQGVRHVRLGISTPGWGFGNDFPREFARGYGQAYLRLIQTIHRINPLIEFNNECAVNLCLMEAEVYDKVVPIVNNLKLRCGTGNPDILPDMSTHWCFAAHGIPELTIKNIFDYQNMNHVVWELQRRERQLQNELGSRCEHGSCDSLRCKGPCVIYNYFRGRVQNNGDAAPAACSAAKPSGTAASPIASPTFNGRKLTEVGVA